jgi:hypothetical protein
MQKLLGSYDLRSQLTDTNSSGSNRVGQYTYHESTDMAERTIDGHNGTFSYPGGQNPYIGLSWSSVGSLS